MIFINHRGKHHCEHHSERKSLSPTSYAVLYDSVISQIKDYAFVDLSDSEIYDILSDYVRPAVVRFQSCKKDLSNRNDEHEMFYDGLSDDEIEILSRFMAIEYIDANYIRVPSLLRMSLTPKDFQTFSPANQLGKMQELRNGYMEENRQLMRDYSYRDSELFSSRREEQGAHGKHRQFQKTHGSRRNRP